MDKLISSRLVEKIDKGNMYLNVYEDIYKKPSGETYTKKSYNWTSKPKSKPSGGKKENTITVKPTDTMLVTYVKDGKEVTVGTHGSSLPEFESKYGVRIVKIINKSQNEKVIYESPHTEKQVKTLSEKEEKAYQRFKEKFPKLYGHMLSHFGEEKTRTAFSGAYKHRKKSTTETTIKYSSIKSTIDKNINDLKNTAEKLATMPSNQVVEINGKPVPVFLARAVVGKNLQDLEKAKNDVEYYRSQGYRIKKTSTGFIFYKTPEDIKKEHYEKIKSEYERTSNVPIPIPSPIPIVPPSGISPRSARAVSSSILFGFANPNFWSGLVTGGVKEARYAIAEEEYKWIKQNREKMRKGGAPEIVKTWAGTYFLSYPMENIVYPMAIGTGASYALGAASAVAPAAASAAEKGMAVGFYGMLGYASADIAYSSFLGKYREALTKTFGYGMQFSSAYAGAKGLGGKTPYERGFEYGRKYWVNKYPSKTVPIIRKIIPVKGGAKIIEGEFISGSRPSLRTMAEAKGKIRGIIDKNGYFHLDEIGGKVKTYSLKKSGGMLQRGKLLSTSSLKGDVLSLLADEIEMSFVRGKYILRGIYDNSILRGGAPSQKYRISGNVRSGPKKFPISIEGKIPENIRIYKNISVGRIGEKPYIGRSYSVSKGIEVGGKKTPIARTRGKIYGREFVDFINDYSFAIDATKIQTRSAYRDIVDIARRAVSPIEESPTGNRYTGRIKSFSNSARQSMKNFVDEISGKKYHVRIGEGGTTRKRFSILGRKLTFGEKTTTPKKVSGGAKGAEGKIYSPSSFENQYQFSNVQYDLGRQLAIEATRAQSQFSQEIASAIQERIGSAVSYPRITAQPHLHFTPAFAISPHVSTNVPKKRHFVTLPSFRTEMGQMKKTLSMSMQEYVQNIGNKIRTETIPKSEVKIEERQQEAGKTIQQSKVRGETTQYLVPIIPTPTPPVTFGFRLFPPLPVLGNLRKSRQETQKGILGYFNELQAAMSVMYGGGYKQKVKKAKNYKRRKKR